MNIKEQREERIKLLGEALLEGISKSTGLELKNIEFDPNALIDLYEEKILDGPEEEFVQFLEEVRDGGQLEVISEDE